MKTERKKLKKMWVKHILEEDSRIYVISYDTNDRHCNVENYEVNKKQKLWIRICRSFYFRRNKVETETEKVILRIGLDGELLGQYNSVKHAANNIDRGNSQCIYNSIWTKKPYRKSLWLYGFIKKEIQLGLSLQQESEYREEAFCLRCGLVFTTHNKKTNRICPKCNIINDNLWDGNIVYKAHASV